MLFKENKGITDLNLDDLDILSNPQFPININYFMIRGVDNQDGPNLIPILKLTYTKTVSLYGHDFEFNFTRINGVNTFGAKINF